MPRASTVKYKESRFGLLFPDPIASTAVMTDTERLQLLTQIAQNSSGTQQVAALKLLEDINRSKGTTLGPPPPSTDEEQITRLADLMRCLPKNSCIKALALAHAIGGPVAKQAQTADIPS